MSGNPLKLKSIHHVELWTGNAKQAAYFYRRAFGFSQIAYAGLETGQRDRASYALAQGKARIVVTSAPGSAGGSVEHVAKHGASVRDSAVPGDDAGGAAVGAARGGPLPGLK